VELSQIGRIHLALRSYGIIGKILSYLRLARERREATTFGRLGYGVVVDISAASLVLNGKLLQVPPQVPGGAQLACDQLCMMDGRFDCH
jgi:hypothetical protein